MSKLFEYFKIEAVSLVTIPKMPDPTPINNVTIIISISIFQNKWNKHFTQLKWQTKKAVNDNNPSKQKPNIAENIKNNPNLKYLSNFVNWPSIFSNKLSLIS